MLKNILSLILPATFILLASCGGAPTPNSCFHIAKKLGFDKSTKKAKVEEITTARMGDTIYFVACDNKDQFYSVWPGDKGNDLSKVIKDIRPTVAGIALIKTDTLASLAYVYKSLNTYKIVFKSSNISSNLETFNSNTSEKELNIVGTNPGFLLK